MVRSYSALYITAAATTAIAGMLHLMLGPNSLNSNMNQAILFTVGGIAQVFWIIPMIKKWGIPWYAIGIGGTIVFMALWIIIRMPGNPITGRGFSAGNPIALTIEVFQAAFIGLAAAIIIHEYRKKKKKKVQEVEKPTMDRDKRSMPILGGIVIALILIGLFALPTLMPSPTGGGGGGPPRQGGGGGGVGGAPPSGTGPLVAPQSQAPTQQNAAGT
ncbi:MAG: hypothetical protein ACJ70N_03680 [Nitrososphaera sp.]